MHLKKNPYLVYCDADGNIVEDTRLYAVGRSAGKDWIIEPQDFIKMPEGSELFLLPQRRPIGFNPKTKQFEVCEKGFAVGVFLAPAHTQFYLASYQTLANAPRLPIFAYTAVGWYRDSFYVPAMRVDPDIRQDCQFFDQKKVLQNMYSLLKKYPHNRLLHHIGENCAKTYLCPAARNFFLKRFEAPLPTSPFCNAECIACISYQPQESQVVAPQKRIAFIPTPEEIAEVALLHIHNVKDDPIVSFGQGCEGEPLLVWETIREAIRLIRKKTDRGVIHLNTNGSLPHALEHLFQAGLDSIRVSLNSVRKEIYNAYYRPRNYCFEDVIESLKVARRYHRWASLNYFVFPGLNDQKEEYEALKKLFQDTQFSMIQWRNFNIDPDWYQSEIGFFDYSCLFSIKKLILKVKEEMPSLYHGYYNPGKKIMQRYGIT